MKTRAVMVGLLLAAPATGSATAWAHPGHPDVPEPRVEAKADLEPQPTEQPTDPEPAAPEPATSESSESPPEAPPPEIRGTPAPAPDDLQPGQVGVDSDSGWRPRTLEDTSWRQNAREDEPSGDDSEYLDLAHILFELRFGPYWPHVDDEPGLTGTPYAKYFGDKPRFYFGLELDWLPLYIPYVGSIGPGFGWGIVSASGTAKVVSTGGDAGADTGLTIFPMHVSAIFRVEGPLRELNIPIVPYIKGGFGFAPWNVDNPNSTSRDSAGTSLGPHLAIGGAIALNAFDPSTARSMRETTGIRYAYLWGEWMFNPLGIISDGMYVGTSTGIVGLALDF